MTKIFINNSKYDRNHFAAIDIINAEKDEEVRVGSYTRESLDGSDHEAMAYVIDEAIFQASDCATWDQRGLVVRVYKNGMLYIEIHADVMR